MNFCIQSSHTNESWYENTRHDSSNNFTKDLLSEEKRSADGDGYVRMYLLLQ